MKPKILFYLCFALSTTIYAQDRLERITENGKTGWRFSTASPTNYGDIGDEAVDLSRSSLSSTTHGATGDGSFAVGVLTTASGFHSFASGYYTIAEGWRSASFGQSTQALGDHALSMGFHTKAEGYATFATGRYNAADTSPNASVFSTSNTAFVIGNGTSNGARSNALKVLFDGTTTIAGELTATKFIGDGSGLTNLPTSAIGMTEGITENGNTGWRITGVDAANYGDIGNGAIDLSVTNQPSSAFGATGDFSFARGLNTTASGEGSIAWGSESVSMGDGSYSRGNNNTAMGSLSNAVGEANSTNGDTSFAFGSNLETEQFLTFAIGQYNYAKVTSDPAAFSSTNAAFIIGNGTATDKRSNALEILFDGTTTITGPVTATKFIGDGSGLTNLPSASGTGLEEVTENGNTGWRLIGADPNSFGDIGSEAVDLSIATTTTDNYGATGDGSFAAGRHSRASGNYSVAIGSGVRSIGNVSFASGINTVANGYGSVAMGGYADASGGYSIAAGDSTNTIGYASVAMGEDTEALGNNSFAVGQSTYARGNFSNALGLGTNAESYGTTAIGQYNAPQPSSNASSYADTNTAFVIGNGTSDSTRSNALEVFFNGDTNISGAVTVQGQVDALSFVGDGSGLTNTPDEQDLTSAILNGTKLTISIENGAAVEVDLAPLLTDIISRLDAIESCACDGSLSSPTTNTATSANFYIHPNPIQQQVNVSYFVPPSAHEAKLILANALGQQVGKVNLPQKGKHTIKIGVEDLNSGIYFCSLEVDGYKKETKRMIVKHD